EAGHRPLLRGGAAGEHLADGGDAAHRLLQRALADRGDRDAGVLDRPGQLVGDVDVDLGHGILPTRSCTHHITPVGVHIQGGVRKTVRPPPAGWARVGGESRGQRRPREGDRTPCPSRAAPPCAPTGTAPACGPTARTASRCAAWPPPSPPRPTSPRTSPPAPRAPTSAPTSAAASTPGCARRATRAAPSTTASAPARRPPGTPSPAATGAATP